MTDEWAVQTSGLTKSYGKTAVLRGVDLRVARGSIFALLGPNGAGKTTMVRILATLTQPDGGTARVAGFDVRRDRHRVRRAISLTGQYAALDDLQTGRENLTMMARLAGLSRARAGSRAAELLQRFDLTEAAGRRAGTYSGGMRRRLDLAASMVVPRAVAFLDEPTTGLDPRGRQAMWETIAGLAGTGTTIFLTTQYLEEADRLADRIAVIDAGRIVADGTSAELKRRVAAQRLDLVFADEAGYAAAVSRLDGRLLDGRLLHGRRVSGDLLHGDLLHGDHLHGELLHRDPAGLVLGLATDGTAGHVRALLDELDPEHRGVRSFAVRGATLDDVFFVLTGESTVEKEAAHV